MTDRPPPNPARLAAQGGEIARLLRSADPEFRDGLAEPRAFQKVERTRRRRTVLSWGFGCACAALVVLAMTSGAGRFLPGPADLTLTPELLPALASPEPRAIEVAQKRPVAPAVEPPTTGARHARSLDSEPPDETRCRSLSTAGKTERAVDCFGALAGGRGIGAEVASYEAARLSAEGLRDAPRALRLLDEHTERFPGGALRGEVAWLRVRTLHEAGRLDEALAASETLLAAPEGRELSSELHWLRARIYENDRHDCRRAVSELVALIGEGGARGDEAEMRRAACLEQLGRASDALAAYEQYLRRAEPKRRVEAQTRIEALRRP